MHMILWWARQKRARTSTSATGGTTGTGAKTAGRWFELSFFCVGCARAERSVRRLTQKIVALPLATPTSHVDQDDGAVIRFYKEGGFRARPER